MTTITVTQDDIFLGEVADCAECPIARAVRRAFPGCASANVGPFAIFVSWLGGRVFSLSLFALWSARLCSGGFFQVFAFVFLFLLLISACRLSRFTGRSQARTAFAIGLPFSRDARGEISALVPIYGSSGALMASPLDRFWFSTPA